MGVSFGQSGSFDNIEAFLKTMSKKDFRRVVEPYARQGVEALRANTPVDSGLAASSWGYEIIEQRNGIRINWTNSNVEDGFPVVIGLQYGYSTGTGGYVQGRDFINPAIRKTFDRISEAIWREVIKA